MCGNKPALPVGITITEDRGARRLWGGKNASRRIITCDDWLHHAVAIDNGSGGNGLNWHRLKLQFRISGHSAKSGNAAPFRWLVRVANAVEDIADIFAVFPTIEWRFADVYTYGGLSPAEMDLLEVCLERSPELGVVALEGGLQIVTTDFMDSRFLPDAPAFVIPAPKAEDGWESAPARRR